MTKITIYIDQLGNQALFVNGDFQHAENKIGIRDIIRVAKEQPIYLEVFEVNIPESLDWPHDSEDLKVYLIK